jgi:hypothetical protein
MVDAIEAAQSLWFPPTPILTKGQASRWVLQEIPEGFVPPAGSDTLSFWDLRYRLSVEPTEGGFVARFQYYEDPHQRTPTKEAHVAIDRVGAIRECE